MGSIIRPSRRRITKKRTIFLVYVLLVCCFFTAVELIYKGVTQKITPFHPTDGPPIPILRAEEVASTKASIDGGSLGDSQGYYVKKEPETTSSSESTPLATATTLSSKSMPLLSTVYDATNDASPSNNYMLGHAQELRQQADSLESTIFPDLIQAKNSNRSAAATRIPYPLHFFTYSTDTMNLTTERILLQASRSQFFESVTALGPKDLPLEFVQSYSDILNDPHGAGNFLWRYPVWELIMNRVPLYEYVLFLDAGCSVLSTGHEMLTKWLDRLQETSETKKDRKELMRFPEKYIELRWTTDALFEAFGLEPDGEHRWQGAKSTQLFGGLLLVRNCAQWRNMTSLIYNVLAKDPYVITDKYSPQTKQRRPGRFEEHRHDQSVSSIASKLLDNYIMAPPMETWGERPPFGVTRFRNIRQDQLENWSKECRSAPRDKDEYCDQLANTVFDANTALE